MTHPDETTVGKLKVMLDRLTRELTAAAHIDDVFWQVQAIISTNATINQADVFQDWIARTYVDSIAIRLRRLVDRDKRSVSIYRLLELMEPIAVQFTRQWFVERWPEDQRAMGDRRFDYIAGTGALHLTAEVLVTKREQLGAALGRVHRYVNKTLAHVDAVRHTEVTTFEDVRQSLAAAVEVFQWCSLVLTTSPYATVVPVPLSNWLSVFDVPWRVPGSPLPSYTHLDALVRDRR